MKKNRLFAMAGRINDRAQGEHIRRKLKEGLSELSFKRAETAYALAQIGRDVFGKKTDPEKAAAAALLYMAPEITEISPSYEEEHPYRALFSFDTEAVSVYTEAACKISAYLKCEEERRRGNSEFEKTGELLRKAVEDMKMPEADYYLEHIPQGPENTSDRFRQEEEQK